jgi:hypothetical protein
MSFEMCFMEHTTCVSPYNNITEEMRMELQSQQQQLEYSSTEETGTNMLTE